ncbi:unnamed protein product [Phytomonas sp. Hart1]|nr:unnamed protein product [Phytomonas sp. Hart1]|eukprot:CCW66860.1 unnamed protein product [Phytomonas sp. isolate Hart1]
MTHNSPRKELNFLQTENERLHRENVALREKLKEQRAQCNTWYEENNLKVSEVYKKIRKLDPHSRVLSIYDELVQMRKVSAVYINAMEEMRTCYLELKNVYTDLEDLVKSRTSTSVNGSSNMSKSAKPK